LSLVYKGLLHLDTNNYTGYAQVLEEGVDADGNGRLDVEEITASGGKTFTLGHDAIAQQAAAVSL